VGVAWSAVAWSGFVLATAGIPHHGIYLALLAGVGVGLAGVYALFFRGRFQGPPKPPALDSEKDSQEGVSTGS
jgi:hypothetical protein